MAQSTQSELTLGSSILEHGLQDPNWWYARTFLADLQRDLERDCQYIVRFVARWEVAFDMVQRYEERVIFQDTSLETELRYLKGIVATTKGLGHVLLQILSRNDQVNLKELIGYDEDAIQAMINELEVMEGGIAAHLTKQQVAELQSIFAPASA